MVTVREWHPRACEQVNGPQHELLLLLLGLEGEVAM